ncbi:MAG: hypothetical protein KGI67_14660 [Pseudomonadota bacterium]|nr:hypothetical protein [Pseudomonadota bacterium]
MKRTLLIGVLCGAPALLGAWHAGAAEANNYPTADRVLFVEECMNDYPDKGRFEMVHKCSCLIDQLARHYTYEQYVDMSTAAKAFTISGERGNVVRDTAMGKALNAEYKKASGEAKEACFMQ